MPTSHPSQLDGAYGRVAAQPVATARFTLTGQQPVTVTPLDGSELRWDASRWPRTTADLVLPTTITPTLLPGAVSAYGGRCTLTVGQVWRGQSWTFTAATLAVAKVDVDRPDAQVRVSLVSLEALVNEDRRDTVEDTPAGLVSAVVRGIVERTLGTVAVVNTLGALDVSLTAGQYQLDGDVWPTVERIMDDAGGEAWFDAAGRLVLRPVPVVAAPALTIAVGGDGGALTGYSSSRTWGPNRVALVYTTPDAQPTLRYTWQAARSTAPAAGRVSVNTADARDATVIYLNRKGTSDQDVAETYAGMQSGDVIRVVQEITNGPDRVLRYRVTGAPTIGAAVVSVPVTLGAYRTGEPQNLSAVTVAMVIRGRRRVGVWEDTRPTSVTYVSGPYGRHTYREDYQVERGTLPSQAEADAAALAMARRVTGRLRGVTLRAIPAPWLLPGDTARITMLGGLTEDHVVQAVRMPLPGLDVMEVTTRDAAYAGGPF